MLEFLDLFSALPKTTEELEVLTRKGEIYDLSATSRRLDGKTRLFVNQEMFDRLLDDEDRSAERVGEKIRQLVADVLSVAIEALRQTAEATGDSEFCYPVRVAYARRDFFGRPISVEAVIPDDYVIYVHLMSERGR